MPESHGESVPKQMQPVYEAIVALMDQFCRQHLDDEYAQMCRKLAAALARKRPSPLAHGKVHVWASGIVYLLGSINFLFDRSNPLYMSAAEISEAFGVGKTTASTKAREIRAAMKIKQWDPRWTLPSRLDRHPYAWYVEFEGLIVDVRTLPRHIQEAAFRKGLIPYVPEPKKG